MAKNEKKETSTALVPSSTAREFTLFRQEAPKDLTAGMVRKNMPQLVTPLQVPVGSSLVAILTGVFPSPRSDIKGYLLGMLVLTVDENGKETDNMEISFPCTGSIRQALAPGMKDDNAGLLKALEAYKGFKIVLFRQPNTINRNFKKEQFIFDVHLSPKAVREVVDNGGAKK